MIEISTRNGFTQFECNSGVSSEVFCKDGELYKLTVRNSVKRIKNDYVEFQRELAALGFRDRLQESEIFLCTNSLGKEVTCVKQQIILGKTIADIGKQGLSIYLSENPREIIFLKSLIKYFHQQIKLRQLYPDLVGNPTNQSLWNSINLMVDSKGIIICDIGLSPHEVTLDKFGEDFFNSKNVLHYKEKMTEALVFLSSLSELDK